MSPAKPWIVAEVSANHQGSLETTLAIVKAVADAGATHVKFQTYTADTLTIDSDSAQFRVSDSHGLWGGRTLYSLYQEAHTPWEWHEQLFAESRALGLVPFSTPFDPSSVDFLERLQPDLYKVASLEVGDLNLIRRICETGKPILLSTGAGTLSDIDDAVKAAEEFGCPQLTLLLCTSAYPARPEDAHLARLDFLQRRYGLPVGLSDHTLGLGVSLAAVALGATVVERHVTLRRLDGGPDSAFSLEPSELAALAQEVANARAALGSSEWHSIRAEDESRRLRRSLYVVRDANAGEEIDKENVRSIRPAGGLPPKFLDEVLGKKFLRTTKRGTPLTWDLIDRPQIEVEG